MPEKNAFLFDFILFLVKAILQLKCRKFLFSFFLCARKLNFFLRKREKNRYTIKNRLNTNRYFFLNKIENFAYKYFHYEFNDIILFYE
jgi:hypothetical protein